MGTGSFPGVKRPGRGVDHAPPTNTENKERIELYLSLPPWAFVACSRVSFTFTFTIFAPCGEHHFYLIKSFSVSSSNYRISEAQKHKSIKA
jgi:hypothetical protein